MLFDELDAGKEWQGIDRPSAIFGLSREDRALMVAHMRLKGIVNLIAQHDAHEEAERKAKRKS